MIKHSLEKAAVATELEPFAQLFINYLDVEDYILEILKEISQQLPLVDVCLD